MAWTAPRTWVTGELVTASQFNAQIRDNNMFLGGLHGALVQLDDNHADLASGTTTTVTWQSAVYDTDGWWDSDSATIFTVPDGFEYVRLWAALRWEQLTAVGIREMFIEVDTGSGFATFRGTGAMNRSAAGLPSDGANAGEQQIFCWTAPVAVSAADEFRVRAKHTHGSAIHIEDVSDTYFAIQGLEYSQKA
jgi:hypothetical protein